MEYLHFSDGGEDPSLVHQGIIAAGTHGEVHKVKLSLKYPSNQSSIMTTAKTKSVPVVYVS